MFDTQRLLGDMSEWTVHMLHICANFRQTGRTDIPLTARGEQQIKEKAEILVGEGSAYDTDRKAIFMTDKILRDHRSRQSM